MQRTIAQSVMDNFLGNAASWYKLTIITFLVINPIVMVTMGTFVAGWLLVGEFIFCLAMALKCYPLQPGGLLAIQGVVLGMTSSDTVFHEAEANFEVILLKSFSLQPENQPPETEANSARNKSSIPSKGEPQ